VSQTEGPTSGWLREPCELFQAWPQRRKPNDPLLPSLWPFSTTRNTDRTCCGYFALLQPSHRALHKALSEPRQRLGAHFCTNASPGLLLIRQSSDVRRIPARNPDARPSLRRMYDQDLREASGSNAGLPILISPPPAPHRSWVVNVRTHQAPQTSRVCLGTEVFRWLPQCFAVQALERCNQIGHSAVGVMSS